MHFDKIPIPTSIITVGSIGIIVWYRHPDIKNYNMHFVKIPIPTSIITVGFVL